MATATTTAAPKVRFVRCPNCLLVLPEVADFPVYKCGGCETILVVKNKKTIAKNTSVLQENEAASANKSVRPSEHGESGSSTLQEVVPSPPESWSSQESGGNRNISTDSHSEEHGENLLVEGRHDGHYEKDQNTSRYNDGDGDMLDKNRSTNSHSEEHGENLSFEGQHNGRYEKDQNTSGESDGDCDMLDGNRSNEGQQNGTGLLQSESLDRYGKVQNTSRDGDGEGDCDLLDENRSNEGPQNGTGLLQMESLEHCNVQQLGSLSTEHHHENEELMLAAGANDMTSQLEGANSELETSNKIDSNIGGSRKGEHRAVNSVRSTDTFESMDFVSFGSEFSEPLECLSKSTTVRSSHAYAGSISSYDGMVDHFPDQQLHSFENNYKPADLSLDLFNKKHYVTEKYGKWHRDEPLEPLMHHRPPRNWPRLERDQYPSQIPLSQRASLCGYAGPSRELQDEFPFDSAFHQFEKVEYSEEENMKLLRMVYELQDQISKTCHLNGKANGRTSTDVPWNQKHFPTYNHKEEPPEDENFYPTYYGRRGWSRRSRFSRVPFLGGAMNTRHGIDNTCLCCHPQAWQLSEQLSPPIFPHNQGFCRAGASHSCYNSYSSCLSSPQRYLEYDISSWNHETIFDDQRYRDHELKRYLREKHHLVRRHIRPTAGGAPFVTCYYCIRPLQLPADFLLFKRRFHQLRCGACSKVLKFSLQKGTHIVPYELVAAEPPTSEAEDYDDAINVRTSGTVSWSHGCMEADPLSYSDDYGHSFCMSWSSDGDHVSRAKFHHIQGSNADVKNMSRRTSKPMETIDSAGPSRSKKVSSKIEGSPLRTEGSPLHQLMGYSSISQVLKGFGPSISETNSFHSGKNTQD